MGADLSDQAGPESAHRMEEDGNTPGQMDRAASTPQGCPEQAKDNQTS